MGLLVLMLTHALPLVGGGGAWSGGATATSADAAVGRIGGNTLMIMAVQLEVAPGLLSIFRRIDSTECPSIWVVVYLQLGDLYQI